MIAPNKQFNQTMADKKIDEIQKNHDAMVQDTFRKLTGKLMRDLYKAGYDAAVAERGIK